MLDFDIHHITGEEKILADALSRIYEGMGADETTDQDYLREEENYINTDTFLPDDSPSSQRIPCFLSQHLTSALATPDNDRCVIWTRAAWCFQ